MHNLRMLRQVLVQDCSSRLQPRNMQWPDLPLTPCKSASMLGSIEFWIALAELILSVIIKFAFVKSAVRSLIVFSKILFALLWWLIRSCFKMLKFWATTNPKSINIWENAPKGKLGAHILEDYNFWDFLFFIFFRFQIWNLSSSGALGGERLRF